jgi:hypothetical protein
VLSIGNHSWHEHCFIKKYWENTFPTSPARLPILGLALKFPGTLSILLFMD